MVCGKDLFLADMDEDHIQLACGTEFDHGRFPRVSGLVHRIVWWVRKTRSNCGCRVKIPYHIVEAIKTLILDI